MAITVTACILPFGSRVFFRGSSLFLRCPKHTPSLATLGTHRPHHEERSSRAAQITCKLPSPSSSQDTSQSPAILGCSRYTDKGNLYTFSLVAAFGGFGCSFCPEKEGKKSQPFNHSFNQFSGTATVGTPIGTWETERSSLGIQSS